MTPWQDVRRLAFFALAAVILAPSLASGASAQTPEGPDFAIPNGWFYTQTNSGGAPRTGYSVVDDGKASFYREFRRLGGVYSVGYPISARFTWDGFETQAFQKLVLQWRPEKNSVDFVNVFDKLNDTGKDNWLLDKKGVPRQAKFDEAGKDFASIQRDRLKLLDANEALKKYYMTTPGDPIAANGLPTAPIQDVNNAYVLRAQRVVLQQWKVNVPWARAGDVTLANGGDVAKEAGLLPADAIRLRMPDGQVVAPPATPTPVPPTPAPALKPIVGPITLSASIDSPLRSGGEGRVGVKVWGGDGAPVQTALVTVIVHFPLKPDDTAYTTDIVQFVQTDASGSGTAVVKIPSSAPAGLGVSVEANALYPPHAASVELRTTLN